MKTTMFMFRSLIVSFLLLLLTDAIVVVSSSGVSGTRGRRDDGNDNNNDTISDSLLTVTTIARSKEEEEENTASRVVVGDNDEKNKAKRGAAESIMIDAKSPNVVTIRGGAGEGGGSSSLASLLLDGTRRQQQEGRRNEIVDSFFRNPSPDEIDFEKLRDEIRGSLVASHDHTLESFLSGIRRKLHRHPELMYQEKQTSSTIQSILSSLDISYTTGHWGVNTHTDTIEGTGGYGIVAHIGSGSSPSILLRADMDALPIVERTQHIDSFQSNQHGKMHACGHDGHVTMLLGAAVFLKSIEDSLVGTVRLVFQPAEEGGAGAKRMIEEGVLLMEPKPQMAFALHVWPSLPSGVIASRPGVLLAAADQFEILISGKGGHAAMPNQTIDPIVAASSLVLGLQTIVSRTLSPLESGVVSVTQFQSGERVFNVIPESAILRGTIRALSGDTLSSIRERVTHLVHTSATVHGCNATIVFAPDSYPPTINDDTLFEFTKEVAAWSSEEGIVRIVEPTMGAEDFSFFTQEIPSTFLLLGQGGHATTNNDDNDEKKNDTDNDTRPSTNYGLHHSHFALDESILIVGVELHVNLAIRSLKKLQLEQQQQQQPQSSSFR